MTLDIPADIKERKAAIKDTHCCPWCGAELTKCDASASPMGGWGTELLYICMSDECPYYVESGETLAAQGIPGGSYRMAWEPEQDWCGPVAASSPTPTRPGQG